MQDGWPASRHLNDPVKSEDDEIQPRHHSCYRKSKSVFEEYEERGGVLEDYEDLNKSKSSEQDQVLKQMIAAQS